MTFSQFMIAFIYNIFNKKSRFFIFLTMWTYLHTTELRREHSQFSNQHVWKYALNFGESLLIIEIPDSSFQKGDNYEILKTRRDILEIPTKKVKDVFVRKLAWCSSKFNIHVPCETCEWSAGNFFLGGGTICRQKSLDQYC